jgi:hypothetical protein
MSEKRRHHLESQVRGKAGFTYTTHTSGNPHTLIITKTQAVYEDAHKKWVERCKTAIVKIRSFNAELLRDLLDDKFDMI